jgi:hypothetical protein
MLFSINTIQTNQELFRAVKFSVSLVMLSKVWAAIDRSKEEEVIQFIKAIDKNRDYKISKKFPRLHDGGREHSFRTIRVAYIWT